MTKQCIFKHLGIKPLKPSEILSEQEKNSERINRVLPEDIAVHNWYRFVLSFPPHLVRKYLRRFNASVGCTVLDPFCGTGTTLVECKKHGISSIGIEANPVVKFASEVKTNWSADPDILTNHIKAISEQAIQRLKKQGIDDFGNFPLFRSERKRVLEFKQLTPDANRLLLKGSISPLPLHKVLELLDTIRSKKNLFCTDYELLALASAIVYRISNLHFGPEVGVRKLKEDVPVVSAWEEQALQMSADLSEVRGLPKCRTEVICGDSRKLKGILQSQSIDAVITSPPYPNEKDYTRTTRLESVILGFINDKKELRELKSKLVRSNTRGVYKVDQDDHFVKENKVIQQIANKIEERRIELGKTSGFERLYARVTKLYFGGMYRHLSEIRGYLKPGASLAYVVGDQASYLRVMIRTGQILAEIANSLGYEVEDIELFRTRLSTATGEKLREEVVVLRWPGV